MGKEEETSAYRQKNVQEMLDIGWSLGAKLEALELGIVTFRLLKSLLLFRGQRLGVFFEALGEATWPCLHIRAVPMCAAETNSRSPRFWPPVRFQESPKQWLSNFSASITQRTS